MNPSDYSMMGVMSMQSLLHALLMEAQRLEPQSDVLLLLLHALQHGYCLLLTLPLHLEPLEMVALQRDQQLALRRGKYDVNHA